ncbi:MAG: response regulator [Anaerolineae bacterium]|jgi:CheY-like chemotaxis protein|nr:response regulator [Anaerolineae bacterium]
MSAHKANPGDKKTGFLGIDPNAPLLNPAETGPLELVIPWVVEFRVVGTTDILKAHIEDEVLIGRNDPARGVKPEIDLDPFNGQDKGVSRRHALLYARDNRVLLRDEGSANGTFINGQALIARQDYRLHDGDRVRLGQLELQTHFVIKPTVNEQTVVGMNNLLTVPRIGSGQRILLLDDDVYVLRVIRYVLHNAGFVVIETQSAADAIREIDEALPDILILELLLAETSGLDIIRYVRQKPDGKTLPIMAITTAVAGFKMDEALRQGVDVYLGKPVAVDELLSGVMNMLSSGHGRQEG